MKKKKRILIVSEFFPRSKEGEARGGVEMRSWQIARRLSDRYEIIVLTSREKDLPGEDSFFNVKVIRCGPPRRYTQKGSLFKRFLFMISVFRKGVRLKPDIVDAQSLVTYLPGYLMARKLGIKAIITCHDVWLKKWVKLFGLLGIIGELYERWYLSRKWDVFIANSHFTKNNLIQNGVKSEKIKVVPNGIDVEAIRSYQVKKNKEMTISSITRLVSYKRTIDLIQAVQKIKRGFPDIQCKIIGSGSERARLEQLVRELNLQDSIYFLGFVKNYQDVIRTLKKSHIFCLPSMVEGFGIVVAEAMACGVPVITTKIPPLLEVTQNGQGALLYEPGNVQELTEKMVTILHDDRLYHRLVKRGFKIAQQYDWDNIVSEIDKIYNEVL